MKKKNIPLPLIIRYFILLALGIPNLFLIYAIATPITVYFSFAILKLIYGIAILDGTSILLNSIIIDLIPACIAGAAYYLLLILNLTTPMTPKTRIKSILFILLSFFILNVGRIVILATLFENGYIYFESIHNLTWYLGSTLILIIVWFINIYLFKIKTIPIYTDFKNIYRNIKKK